MGTIYKRPNSKNWWLKYYEDGRPVQRSSGTPLKKEARRILKQIEGELSQGKKPTMSYGTVKFQDLAEGILADYQINNRKSLAGLESRMKPLNAFFGRMKVTDITTDVINRFIQKRLKEQTKTRKNKIVSNAEVNRELAALKRMFNLAAQQTPPKVPFVPYIPMLKEDNVREGFFEYDEFQRVKAALPAYLVPVAEFGYLTGWRKGEILGLTWDRIDLEEGTIRLERGETKNKQGREIYIEDELLDLLRTQKKKISLGCPYVFHRYGKKISRFDASWTSACKRAGIGHRLFHDFRRTAVRDMVRAEIPERVAMTISGHKSRSVFDRYNIVSPRDLQEAARKRGAYRKEQTRKSHRYSKGTVIAFKKDNSLNDAEEMAQNK